MSHDNAPVWTPEEVEARKRRDEWCANRGIDPDDPRDPGFSDNILPGDEGYPNDESGEEEEGEKEDPEDDAHAKVSNEKSKPFPMAVIPFGTRNYMASSFTEEVFKTETYDGPCQKCNKRRGGCQYMRNRFAAKTCCPCAGRSGGFICDICKESEKLAKYHLHDPWMT